MRSKYVSIYVIGFVLLFYLHFGWFFLLLLGWDGLTLTISDQTI